MSQPIPMEEEEEGENNEDILLQENVDFQMTIRRLRNEIQEHVREKESLRNQVKSLQNQLDETLKTTGKILTPQKYRELNRVCGFDDSWKLLFRASEHGFKASTFHSRCDNIPGTLVIIETIAQIVIGGWNPVRWNEANSDYFGARGAWIFGFSKDKIVKIDSRGSNSIYCHPKYGPTFGGAIVVVDDCNTRTRDHVCTVFKTEYVYGNPGCKFTLGYEYPGKQERVSFGSYKFNILEYEVYGK